MRVKELNNGFAIVIYNNYLKYKENTFAFRIISDLDDAKYNCQSLCRADGINYAVYDCTKRRLVY